MKQEVRINLGAGPDGIEGWINFDWGLLPALAKFPLIMGMLVKIGVLSKQYNRKWKNTRLADLRMGIPLSSESVDWVYSSNFLEHLEKYEAEKLLKDCYRVVKKGGRLRIVVPDLEKIVSRYRSGGSENFNREYYGFDKDVISGPTKFAIRGHQWMYDFDLLKILLEKCGFSKVVRSEYRKGNMPDIERLDLEIHKELGLYVEATKL